MIPSSMLAAMLAQTTQLPDTWMQSLPQAGPGGPMAEYGLAPPASAMPTLQGREHLGPPMTEYSDIPPWLQALADDEVYRQNRVIESPYGGWGGGAMQMRRRGLR